MIKGDEIEEPILQSIRVSRKVKLLAQCNSKGRKGFLSLFYHMGLIIIQFQALNLPEMNISLYFVSEYIYSQFIKFFQNHGCKSDIRLRSFSQNFQTLPEKKSECFMMKSDLHDNSDVSSSIIHHDDDNHLYVCHNDDKHHHHYATSDTVTPSSFSSSSESILPPPPHIQKPPGDGSLQKKQDEKLLYRQERDHSELRLSKIFI